MTVSLHAVRFYVYISYFCTWPCIYRQAKELIQYILMGVYYIYAYVCILLSVCTHVYVRDYYINTQRHVCTHIYTPACTQTHTSLHICALSRAYVLYSKHTCALSYMYLCRLMCTHATLTGSRLISHSTNCSTSTAQSATQHYSLVLHVYSEHSLSLHGNMACWQTDLFLSPR